MAPSLGEIRQAGVDLHRLQEDAIVRLRLNGGSWADVGRALGISKQSAWQRFRYLDGHPQDPVIGVRVVEGRAEFVSTRLGEVLPVEPRDRRLAVLSAGRQLRELTP